MPDSPLIVTLERRLIALNLPPKRRKRAIEELREHREDLINAAMEQGASKADAETRADQSLGDPTEIADQIVLAARHSSWWGRHPFISFCLLPFFTMFFAIALSAIPMGTFALCAKEEHWQSLKSGGQWLVALSSSIRCTHVLMTALTSLLFCWLFARTVSRRKWLWIACGICGFESYFLHVFIAPHDLWVGLVWPVNVFRPFAFFCACIPFAVAAFLQVRQRKIEASRIFATTTACASLLVVGPGCAGPKSKSSETPTHTRAWVGGEYAIVRKPSQVPIAPDRRDSKYPKSLPRSKAVRVVALATNSPAYASGLRTNDYIVEFNQHQVHTPRQLRSLFNDTPPGSSVDLAVNRDNQRVELTIHTGTEKFQNHGFFALMFPTFVEGWDLWPNPGFSLVFIGYEPNAKLRRDLNGKRELTTDKWHAWCVIFEVASSDQIVAQTASH